MTILRQFSRFFWPLCLMLLLTGPDGLAQSTASAPAAIPWDSLMADLQIIENARVADSTRAQLTRQLFNDYQLTIADYRDFYRDFLQKPLAEQRQFLEAVQKILKTKSGQFRNTGGNSAVTKPNIVPPRPPRPKNNAKK